MIGLGGGGGGRKYTITINFILLNKFLNQSCYGTNEMFGLHFYNFIHRGINKAK